MPVQFKFRGEKTFRSLLNVTTPCTLQRVKSAIYEQARISDSSTDLSLDDQATGKALEARSLLVPDALVQLVVRRTPFQQDVQVTSLAAGSSDDLLHSEENLAIDRVIGQADVGLLALPSSAPMGGGSTGTNSAFAKDKWKKSYALAIVGKQREEKGYEGESDGEEVFETAEPPPANYTCHRCGTTGDKPNAHWVWDCPTNEDPDHMKKVRSARGVPRQFLQKVASIEEGQELSAGGVTFTLPGHSGHYIIAHQNTTYEEKKLRVGDTVEEKVAAAFSDGARKVEESLKCPLCNQMFRQAILAPCCGATFCSDCIIDRLAHSSVDNSRCPGCDKEVLAHQLIANEDIRRQVDQITRSSQAYLRGGQPPPSAQLAVQDAAPKLEVDDLLRERVHRPPRRAGSGASLALSDAPAAVEMAAQGPPVDWQPVGFGPLLAAEQFAAWRRALRAGRPTAAVKAQFEDWQRQMRLVAPPPQPAAPPAAPVGQAAPVQAAPEFGAAAPPSRESFEEWQKMLRERRHATANPPSDGGSSGGARKRSRRERRERR